MKKGKGIQVLTTSYEEIFDRNRPLPDYPRPSLVRESFLLLNGSWDFQISENEELPETYSETIIVPYPMESRLSGVERTHKKGEYLYYRKKVLWKKKQEKDKLLFHIEAADQETWIYLNGSLIGHSSNGYLPITVSIPNQIWREKEENEIVIRIKDDLLIDYPHGKQKKKPGGIFYTETSGIWGSVWLEEVPDTYITGYQVKTLKSQDNRNHDIVISSNCMEGDEGVKSEWTLAIYEPQINRKPERMLEHDYEILTISSETGQFVFRVPEEKLWSEKEPYLYAFCLQYGEDAVYGYFGIRTVSLKENRIFVNDSPVFLNGVLDQGYFPDGIYTPASYQAYLDDINAMKDLGFNTLRKHIKIELEPYYYYCDCMGMYLVQDMVNNGKYAFIRDTAIPSVLGIGKKDKHLHRSSAGRKIFENAMKDTVRFLGNHPSILVWTIFNEGWGQFCADEMYEKCKKADNTRLIDATSGWWKQKKSDFDSIHVYSKPIIIKPADHAVFLSEFGGFVYPVADHIYHTGHKRTLTYQFYKDQESFQKDFFKCYRKEIIPQAGKMAGCIYTQLSDVEDEKNGLLTYDRKVLKLEPQKTKKLFRKLTFDIDQSNMDKSNGKRVEGKEKR